MHQQDEANTGSKTTTEPAGPSAGIPHLALGFFLIASTLVVAVIAASSTSGGLQTLTIAIAGFVTTGLVYGLMIAKPTIAALVQSEVDGVRMSGDTNELRNQVHGLIAEQERSGRKVQRLGGILSATQHELNREITMLGFAVDDLVDGAEDGDVTPELIDGLKLALNHVEEGQRNVTALSRLGTGDKVDRVAGFRASDIAPLSSEMDVVIERDDLIYGDPALWRLFVKNAARNAEAHGHADSLTLSSGDGRLTISDDGRGTSTANLEQAWKAGLRPNGTRSDGTQIMRRVAEAHQAYVTMQGEEDKGVRFVVDLRDLEIDLRDRNAIPEALSTPHKASGARRQANKT